MAENTKIQWCDHTFNCWRGCEKVSEGCKFCYAASMAKINPDVLGVWGSAGTRVVASDAQWRKTYNLATQAREAGRRERVFCASMADVFEDWRGKVYDSQGTPLAVDRNGRMGRPAALADPIRNATLDDVRFQLFFYVIATVDSFDWLMLTKRPENVMPTVQRLSRHESELPMADTVRNAMKRWLDNGPLPNVWLGTSVENQETADSRLPAIRKINAAVRFVSCEPMLENIDFDGYLDAVDWVICGGESESKGKARPFDLRWAESVRDQCKVNGVPFFMKQLGSNPFMSSGETNGIKKAICERHNAGWIERNITDSKGGDISEWPENLRVREFPTAV
jgi:protein gp37